MPQMDVEGEMMPGSATCPDVPFGLALHVRRRRDARARDAARPQGRVPPSGAVCAAGSSHGVGRHLAGQLHFQRGPHHLGRLCQLGHLLKQERSAWRTTTACFLLSAFDVYAAGMTNLEPSHVGTPYAGTYGCR